MGGWVGVCVCGCVGVCVGGCVGGWVGGWVGFRVGREYCHVFYYNIYLQFFCRTMIPISYSNQINYFIMEKYTLEIKNMSCSTPTVSRFDIDL